MMRAGRPGATVAGVVSFGDRTAAIFQGAYDAAVVIWGSLPGAIGDFAFQALRSLTYRELEVQMNGPLAGEMDENGAEISF